MSPIDQMHFGGGTPSYLPIKSLLAIVESLGSHFGLSQDRARDFSIEVDPRGVDFGKLSAMTQAGFNRISFGVQDFDIGVQQAINRVQPYELVESVYGSAQRAGFESINLDLIYGLPLKDYDAAIDRGALPTQRGVHIGTEDRVRAQIIPQINRALSDAQCRHGIR
jgi:oxygen-independent coproporphyrinogen III oxidase